MIASIASSVRRAAFGERHAEHVELAFDVAGADADDRAAARERVERRERLGRLQRVLIAATNTFVITRVRVVRAAMYPSVGIGSNHCVDIISAGSRGIAT